MSLASSLSRATYKDVTDFGESMTRRYRKDFWKHQPEWLMVVSEKSTVSGIIRPILDRYAVDLLVMHGSVPRRLCTI